MSGVQWHPIALRWSSTTLKISYIKPKPVGSSAPCKNYSCVCLWWCTIAIHNTALNCSDNLPSRQSPQLRWCLLEGRGTDQWWLNLVHLVSQLIHNLSTITQFSHYSNSRYCTYVLVIGSCGHQLQLVHHQPNPTAVNRQLTDYASFPLVPSISPAVDMPQWHRPSY